MRMSDSRSILFQVNTFSYLDCIMISSRLPIVKLIKFAFFFKILLASYDMFCKKHLVSQDSKAKKEKHQ